MKTAEATDEPGILGIDFPVGENLMWLDEHAVTVTDMCKIQELVQEHGEEAQEMVAAEIANELAMQGVSPLEAYMITGYGLQ